MLLLCGALCGCFPPTETKIDESKNPYFLEGKARVKARDFKGAIEAFEKALEVNPQSALAHFELGYLYEQHSEQSESDYINAMFHYQQVVKIRPAGIYPHDNAKVRIASCKQELVKAESIAPVYYAMEREMQKLKDENQSLRRQVEAAQPRVASPAAAPASPSVAQLGSASPSSYLSAPTNAMPGRNESQQSARGAAATSPEYITPLPFRAGNARMHVVKDGETPASIARFYRVRLDSLMSANPNLNPKKMRAGQTIKVPPPS
jgi:tetratricopeptide (TPR) repeat protein